MSNTTEAGTFHKVRIAQDAGDTYVLPFELSPAFDQAQTLANETRDSAPLEPFDKYRLRGGLQRGGLDLLNLFVREAYFTKPAL